MTWSWCKRRSTFSQEEGVLGPSRSVLRCAFKHFRRKECFVDEMVLWQNGTLLHLTRANRSQERRTRASICNWTNAASNLATSCRSKFCRYFRTTLPDTRRESGGDSNHRRNSPMLVPIRLFRDCLNSARKALIFLPERNRFEIQS